MIDVNSSQAEIDAELAASVQKHAHEDVEVRFNYHPPRQPGVIQRMETLRSRLKELAHEVVDLVPRGRERSQALTDLEDALMHCNAGIARHQTEVKENLS